MSELYAWYNTVAQESLGLLLLDTIVKATMLLVVACLVAVLLRRASAAVRHRVWCLSFGGLLLLPVLSSLLPGWRLAVLPEFTESDAVAAADHESVRTADSGIAPSAMPLVADRRDVTATPWDGRLRNEIAGDVDGAGPARESGTVPAADAESPIVPTRSYDPAVFPISWQVLTGVVWLLGLSIAGLPVVVGLIRNRILGRAARPIVENSQQRLMSELCHSLGVRRDVRLLETHRSLMPRTWGVLRPIVLLPITWRDWPRQRQRLVLLHELAHVKRYDVAFQLLARLACVLYWFHPLAWYALRRLRTERELACDDCVLMAGGHASEYARHLVQIVRSHRVAAMPAAVAMAQSTKLERRVRALLDRARSHLPLGRTAGRLLLVGAALMVTVVAVVRPTDKSEAKEKPITVAAERLPAEQVAVTAVTSADQTKQPEGGSSDSEDDMRLAYHGRVVAPDGKPVAGAKVFQVYWFHGAPLDYVAKPRAVTDNEGRFEFATTRSDFEPEARSAWHAYTIVATADGYGFADGFSVAFETTGNARKLLPAGALIYLKEILSNPTRVLKLVPDDTPISGRVTTVDGEPVPAARVRVDRLWFNDEGNLDSWEEAAKDEKADFYSLRRHTTKAINGPQLPFIIPDVTTDEKGCFTLRGIGRERIVQLLISGPGIESLEVKTRTRKGEKVVVPHQWRSRGPSGIQETYYGSEFVHAPGPSKPILGRVTDADTGKPVSGVLISAGQMGTFFRGGSPFIADVTDRDGRYRLEGLPLEKRNRISAFPTADSAYPTAGASVDTQVDEPTVTQDFPLKQGVWVQGQAIDDRTGKPIIGHVQYFAFRDNPHQELFPHFKMTYIAHERRTDEDGRFRIAVLPGPGIVAFKADDHSRYRRGLGAETITGSTLDMGGRGKTFRTVPGICHSANEHALRQIDPEVGSDPIELTLTLTSGTDLTGRLLDPDGKPLSGGVVCGNIQSAWYPIHGETFQIQGYYPDRPRDLYFHHPERNLAGRYRLEGKPPKPLTIKLQPAGAVRGRLVDHSGKPMTGISLRGEGVPSENYGNADLRIGTGQDGRFHIRGLIPGRKYTVEASGNRRYYGRILIDMTVEAGQTKDVGDVTFQPPDASRLRAKPGS